MMKTLRAAKVGETVRVVKLSGEGATSEGSWIWGSRRARR
jgi:hypothetical protein